MLWCSLPLLLVGVASAQPAWHPLSLAEHRFDAAIAHDPVRQRFVRFGGVDANGNALADTSESDGSDWMPLQPATMPPPRAGHVMAYDGVRNRVVLFGGTAAGTWLADTWEWDGVDWVQRTPPTSPPARAKAAMCLDAARGRLVLFGGANAGGLLGDTWEWDGTTWTQRTSAPSPSARSGHALAFDSRRQRTVLFGGATSTGTSAETWEYDGTTWVQHTPALAPAARQQHAMAYHEGSGRVVLLGGRSGAGPLLFETWEWDGGTWQQPAGSINTPLMRNHAMAGGTAGAPVLASGVTDNDSRGVTISLWDGTTWTARPRAATLSQFRCATLDSRRGRLVAVDGTSLGWNLLEGDGRQWTLVTAGGNLTMDFTIAYDEARGVTIMRYVDRGRWGSATTLLWDGTSIGSVSDPVPTGSYGGAMAHDSARGRTVLLVSDLLSSTTWECDGKQWVNVTPATTPPSRSAQTMAYDAARKRVVLFGGDSPWTGPLDDTWEWDGTAWLLMPSPTKPAPRSGAAAAFDPRRGRVVLQGGRDATTTFADTWEWDGTTWSPVTVSAAPTPPGQSGHSMVWDTRRGELLTLGGSGQWSLGTVQLAGVQRIGNGCGSNAPPRLSASVPAFGVRRFVVDVVGAPRVAPHVLAFGAAPQNLGLGAGCTLYVRDPLVTLVGTTGATGFASTALELPVMGASLRGATLYAQALVVDAAAPFGFALTGGLQLTIGD